MYPDEYKWTQIDPDGPIWTHWTKINTYEHKWTQMYPDGHKWTQIDPDGHI